MTVNILKTVQNNFSNQHYCKTRATRCNMYIVVSVLIFFLGPLKSKKTYTSVYGILNESLSPKHLKSYRINPIIFKYIEYGETKVLVWDTKSNITSK